MLYAVVLINKNWGKKEGGTLRVVFPSIRYV